VSEGPAEVDGELPLRAENARLLRLLKLTRAQAAPPRPVQTGFFEAPPGPVHAGSPPEAKVALFGALFAAVRCTVLADTDASHEGCGRFHAGQVRSPASPYSLVSHPSYADAVQVVRPYVYSQDVNTHRAGEGGER
jgi:hypothetical protein